MHEGWVDLCERLERDGWQGWLGYRHWVVMERSRMRLQWDGGCAPGRGNLYLDRHFPDGSLRRDRHGAPDDVLRGATWQSHSADAPGGVQLVCYRWQTVAVLVCDVGILYPDLSARWWTARELTGDALRLAALWVRGQGDWRPLWDCLLDAGGGTDYLPGERPSLPWRPSGGLTSL